MVEFKLSKEEREFQFLGNEASDAWDFWTHSEVWVRRMQKLGYTLEKDHQGGWSCQVPLNRVRVLKAEKPKRELSEKQREVLSKTQFRKKSRDNIPANVGQSPLSMVQAGGG